MSVSSTVTISPSENRGKFCNLTDGNNVRHLTRQKKYAWLDIHYFATLYQVLMLSVVE